jgi:hypothetical protein
VVSLVLQATRASPGCRASKAYQVQQDHRGGLVALAQWDRKVRRVAGVIEGQKGRKDRRLRTAARVCRVPQADRETQARPADMESRVRMGRTGGRDRPAGMGGPAKTVPGAKTDCPDGEARPAPRDVAGTGAIAGTVVVPELEAMRGQGARKETADRGAIRAERRAGLAVHLLLIAIVRRVRGAPTMSRGKHRAKGSRREGIGSTHLGLELVLEDCMHWDTELSASPIALALYTGQLPLMFTNRFVLGRLTNGIYQQQHGLPSARASFNLSTKVWAVVGVDLDWLSASVALIWIWSLL